jgi:hypothetical protein
VKKWPLTLSTEYLFHSRKVFEHAVKSYDMGPTGLLPLRRKSYCGINRPRPSFNPQILGPMASTLTTRPPILNIGIGWKRDIFTQVKRKDDTNKEWI